MATKDDIIRVRVSKEQKELFKSIAKEKNVSMSEFMVVATEERALREKEKIDGTESLEFRVEQLEVNYKRLRLKWRAKEKKFFKNIFEVGLQIEP